MSSFNNKGEEIVDTIQTIDDLITKPLNFDEEDESPTTPQFNLQELLQKYVGNSASAFDVFNYYHLPYSLILYSKASKNSKPSARSESNDSMKKKKANLQELLDM